MRRKFSLGKKILENIFTKRAINLNWTLSQNKFNQKLNLILELINKIELKKRQNLKASKKDESCFRS
jgi:DNA polymerase III alpha subunit (gram-positive type)